MNPTNKPIPIQLGGKKHTLLFDLNTFSAFEEVTGKFFLDFLASLQEALVKTKPAKGATADPQAQVMALLRFIRVGDIHSMLWAALHTYDQNDEPTWPYTKAQLGKLINIDTIPTLLPALFNGASENLPSGKPEPGDGERPTNGAGPTLVNGGTTSGPTDEEVLASMTMTSEG